MTGTMYRYTFDDTIPIKEIHSSLTLAVLVAEIIFGRELIRLDAVYRLDIKKRSCVIDGGTTVGRTIARIFSGFLSREFGEEAFTVARIVNNGTPVRETTRTL